MQELFEKEMKKELELSHILKQTEDLIKHFLNDGLVDGKDGFRCLIGKYTAYDLLEDISRFKKTYKELQK